MPQAERPLYLPFLRYPGVVHMGLEKLDLQEWIQPDHDFNRYYQNKLRVYQQIPERVSISLPSAQAAAVELAARLLAHLTTDHADRYTLRDAGQMLQLEPEQLQWPVSAQPNLQDVALWVQDDLCLLQEVAGQYVLTAASLCAPSNWDLREKIGKPISEIHAPVPGLNKAIGKQIDHVLNKLSPLRPFQRFNWSIKDSEALALLPGEAGSAAGQAGSESLFLRVERQTLTRLPTSGAIAFTIRVYITPLAQLASIEGALEALRAAVHAMSAQEGMYKDLVPLFPVLQQFFKRII
ncbi:MAG: DUF3445 domain-containing protein [Gammaproteobacteria bacterium]|nr:DUF3445 domain-containing protein [Gammaproteobacteria bacterium]NNM10715.1 DUF3445 domain-containing protein [Pseudomonadales bacterium]